MPKKRYKVLLHQQALAEIKKLPKKFKEKVKERIDNLVEQPVPPDARGLKGRKNAYRIRVGKYRILYEVNVREIVVYVIGIGHRKEVYRLLLRRR